MEHKASRAVLRLCVLLAVATAAACNTTEQPKSDDTSASQPSARLSESTVAPTQSASAPAKPSLAVNEIPPKAWIASNQLPLNDSLHWPELGDVAEPVSSQSFQSTSLCGGQPESMSGSNNAIATVDNGTDSWSAQQVIVHYPGDPWTMGQTAQALFTDLQTRIGSCQKAAAGTTITVTTPSEFCTALKTGGCHQLATTIENPERHVTAHVYLVVAGSTVTEVTVWSSGTPSVSWSMPTDSAVFDAMTPQLCTAWKC